MKVYVHDFGITLAGKGWEILQKLKDYNKDFVTVADGVQNTAQK
jgi:hypothetical protein